MSRERVKALGLLSGGLDSLLAARLLMEQGIDVVGVTFESPFFKPDRALSSAAELQIQIRVKDVTESILRTVESPPHGYGKNLNPCVDCHAMMLREAGGMMKDMGCSFLFTGEVLGQRPFSQNYRALRLVAELSGHSEWIVRPLSARLLPKTPPEEMGLVDRGQLLDIQGRSRARQLALAHEWKIREFSSPAGGCSLTDPGFAHRLRDLLLHERPLRARAVETLRVGRHFRLGGQVKAVVGRKHSENLTIQGLRAPEDALLEVVAHPGPTVLLTGPYGEEDIARAARLAVRYSDAPRDETTDVHVDRASEMGTVTASAAEDGMLDQLRI